jgi:hypothetical protein
MCHGTFDNEYKYCCRSRVAVDGATQLLVERGKKSWINRDFGVFSTLEYQKGKKYLSNILSLLCVVFDRRWGIVCDVNQAESTN